MFVNRWPDGGVARVSQCPICGSADRTVLHSDLQDRVFYCAPGTWTMVSCTSCECAYLDPQPTPETLPLAYERYYTKPQERDHSLRVKTRGFSAMLNRCLLRGISSKVRQHDRVSRHMPQASVGARLLDVGFGDGKFLARAASAGYRVSGCDIDSDVIDAALKRGFDVRAGGIESFENVPESFDVITLGHSIEHVYDPLATLRQAYALLKPGGMIWIETPNIRSYGHDRFGAHWRGLEPPRHLVLFHWEKLESVLKDVGFVSVTRLPFFENFYKLAKQSQAIIEGKDPNDWDPISEPSPWTVFSTWVQTRFWHPEKTEFITLIARKVSDKSR